jgi:DNA-binding NarL/FixJ family response regulator
MALRVGLADDSLLIRAALARLLEGAEGIEVAAVCTDADELREAIEHEPLDVVVVDICMPPTMTDEGIRLASELRDTHPGLGVVVLSAYCEPAYALALLADGSDGRAYLLKDRLGSRPQLLATIEAVASGGSVIDPKVVESLVHGEAGHARSLLTTLSPREHEVLVEMARGASNAAIAEQLGLTKRAVEKHINAVFAKLELPVTPDISRRVRAVLLFLSEEPAPTAGA